MTIEDFTNKADGLINDFSGGAADEKEFRDGILDLLLEVATPAIQVQAKVMQKIAGLIEHLKTEASEPLLTLKAIRKFETIETEQKKIKTAMDGYTKMMKKKYLEWIKILESNFSV